MRIVKAFKKLNENTALYFAKQRKDGKKSEIIMERITSKDWASWRWRIEFQFSDLTAPYILNYNKTSTRWN